MVPRLVVAVVTLSLALGAEAAATPMDDEADAPLPSAYAGGDAAAGGDMAGALCARCHAVGLTGESPLPEAPPFRTFSQLWPLESLDEALAEGIMVGHPRFEMPVFEFSVNEVADLMAYLESIQTAPADDASDTE